MGRRGVGGRPTTIPTCQQSGRREHRGYEKEPAPLAVEVFTDPVASGMLLETDLQLTPVVCRAASSTHTSSGLRRTSGSATKMNATRVHSGSRGDTLAFGRRSDRESAERPSDKEPSELSSNSECVRMAGMADAELTGKATAEVSERGGVSIADGGEAAAADQPLVLSLVVDLSESGSGDVQMGERGGGGVTAERHSCVGASGPRTLHQSA